MTNKKIDKKLATESIMSNHHVESAINVIQLIYLGILLLVILPATICKLIFGFSWWWIMGILLFFSLPIIAAIIMCFIDYLKFKKEENDK